MQVFDFPKPPSTNKLYYRPRKGAPFRTKEYVTWMNAAGWEIKSKTPKVKQLREPCEVHIYLNAPRMDVDNSTKPIMDLLESSGVILNDKLVTRLTVERANVEGVRVVVRAFQAEAA